MKYSSVIGWLQVTGCKLQVTRHKAQGTRYKEGPSDQDLKKHQENKK